MSIPHGYHGKAWCRSEVLASLIVVYVLAATCAYILEARISAPIFITITDFPSIHDPTITAPQYSYLCIVHT